MKRPDRVNHLKNSTWVRKGTKESCEVEAECPKLKELRRAKVLGEMNFMTPAGRGIIWNKTRRRKRKRQRVIVFMRKCGVRSGELVVWVRLFIAPRRMIRRMLSSMSEKAHGSIDPKAIGVKIKSRVKMNLIPQSNMVMIE
jgi:hypothetical protein